ncbi:MAG: Imm52 family immunity protein [Micromonosporaceae bacterium]
MTADGTWTIEARWDARGDDLPTCARRLSEWLTGLTRLDPTLGEWYREVHELDLDPGWLKDVLENQATRWGPEGPTGWELTLWNGIEDDAAVAPMWISCGSAGAAVRDGLVFQLPHESAAPKLHRRETLLRVWALMISAWQPQWCRVRRGEFRQLARDLQLPEAVTVPDQWR